MASPVQLLPAALARERGTAGRIPPHSLEMEEALLGCCLLDRTETMARCFEAKLVPASFYSPAHRLIFARMAEIYQRRTCLDVAILGEELKGARELEAAGGYEYLARLSGSVATSALAEYFLDKVRALHFLRLLIGVATAAIERCHTFTGNIEAVADEVERDIFEITHARGNQDARSMMIPTREAMAGIGKMLSNRGELSGVSSGFAPLDQLLWGFQRQDMIVLAARPSVGKTALALNFAEAAALPATGTPAPVLIFSLEMSAAQLAVRMICARARINLRHLREGFIKQNGEERGRMSVVAEELANAPIHVDDSSHLTVMQLRAKARRAHARRRLGLIIVDYLQLLAPIDPAVPREQQVAEASRGLKALAKELDIPVVVLSQLNRASEKESRPPRLSDLRESGSIEQDADVVLLLARSSDADENFQDAADSADLIVAKQRNGPVGEIKLKFFRELTRFGAAE